MGKWLLSFLILITVCCNPQKKIKDNNLDILIEEAASKYDLETQTYTVYRNKGDTTIQFELTEVEKQEIIDYYYNLELDELHDKLTIEDNCSIMPKLYSTLTVKCKTAEQQIIVDTDCKNYKGLFSTKGKRITSVISFVEKLIQSKPGVKSAPESDYIFE
jgi:hypothetical protein